jgi:hypothetical protein
MTLASVGPAGWGQIGSLKAAVQFTDVPTEQTTAATDVLVSIIAAVFAVVLAVIGEKSDKTKGRIWSATLSLLAVASGLGAIAHGLQMSESTNEIIWMPLNLALGLTVALFVVGAVYDLRGFSIPRALTPIMLAVGAVFFGVTLIMPGSFIIFVIYEAAAMLFALVTYISLAARRTLRGAWMMTVGVFTSIIAAAVQASGTVHFTLIWEFDSNGAFHLIQIAGLVFLVAGLYADLAARRSAAPASVSDQRLRSP